MRRSGDTNNFRFGKNLVRGLSGNIRIAIHTRQGFGKLCGADQLRTLRVYHERGRFLYGATSMVLGSDQQVGLRHAPILQSGLGVPGDG
jgi:hypothetical protein